MKNGTDYLAARLKQGLHDGFVERINTLVKEGAEHGQGFHDPDRLWRHQRVGR